MSFISGEFFKKGERQQVQITEEDSQLKFRSEYYLIEAGGNSLLTFEIDEVPYIVCGTGLNSHFGLMSKEKWIKYFNSKNNLKDLDGHFLILKIGKDRLQIWNDQLGLREIFFYETDEKVFFSSRLDKLLEKISSPDLNYYYLCSLWNHANPIVYETLIQNVLMLGQGGSAVINVDGLKICSNPWISKITNYTIADTVEITDSIIKSLIRQEKLNLGLSGGMDSRTLYSILLDHNRDKWSTYTFGPDSDLDVIIANFISRTRKTDHHHYNSEFYSNDKIFGTWQDFVDETNCFLPADYYHKLSYYKLLPANEFFIDGGKGEYIRRGLSNRIAKLGAKAFLTRNIEKIKALLNYSKPDIFTVEVTGTWDLFLEKQVTELLESMPAISDLGFENWLDLFNIRFRTGNTGYVSQGRLDGIVRNLMPLIQPSILNGIMNIKPQKRASGIINKKILNRHYSLNFYPLAHDHTVIPFQHNKYSSYIWKKVMKLMIRERSDARHQFISQNRDYIFTRFSESDYLNSAVMDKKKIEKNVKDYFKGDLSKADFIIWWLTFDKWHKLVYAR